MTKTRTTKLNIDFGESQFTGRVFGPGFFVESVDNLVGDCGKPAAIIFSHGAFGVGVR